MNSNLLAEVIRGELQEKFFTGWVLVVNQDKKIIRTLDKYDYSCYLRSSEKPMQAVLALESGVQEKYNLEQADIALSFASHTGSEEHIKRIEKLLEKIGLTENDLLCGIHPPVDIDERQRLFVQDKLARTLHNNCSAKHLFIIATCLIKGWDICSYKELDHPAQRRISEIIQELCRPEKIYYGYDGCDMPVHGMDLVSMGAGFAKLFGGSHSEGEILADAVVKYPIVAGGRNRLDSSIMQGSKGILIAKVGAEGLLIVTARHSGEALVVKIADGDMDMRNYVTIEALRQIGWLDAARVENEFLNRFAKTDIHNFAGKKVGDIKFRFEL